jgi:DNA-binding CsgD family transcriptional regulator
MVESKKELYDLTEREITVLKLISKGYTTKEISSMLNISHYTVDTYRKSIQNKLDVKNCTEAVYKATKLNLYAKYP